MPLKLNEENGTRDVLDFSRLIINTQEELDQTLEKIPDYRNRPEKVRTEDLQIGVRNLSFTITQAELQTPEFNFMCPIPHPMQEVKLEDLRHVDINWHMMTQLRPETKQDEEIFNRIIQLERITYKSVVAEVQQAEKQARRLAEKSKKGKSKITGRINRNVASTIGRTCSNCSLECCNGSCEEFFYESHERLPPADDEDGVGGGEVQQPLEDTEAKEGGEKKGKKKTKKKKGGGKKSESSAEANANGGLEGGGNEEKKDQASTSNATKKRKTPQGKSENDGRLKVGGEKPKKRSPRQRKSTSTIKNIDESEPIVASSSAEGTGGDEVVTTTTTPVTNPVKKKTGKTKASKSKSDSKLNVKKSSSPTKSPSIRKKSPISAIGRGEK